jgi:hypothetical protein
MMTSSEGYRFAFGRKTLPQRGFLNLKLSPNVILPALHAI